MGAGNHCQGLPGFVGSNQGLMTGCMTSLTQIAHSDPRVEVAPPAGVGLGGSLRARSGVERSEPVLQSSVAPLGLYPAKRLIDVCVAGAALLALAPLMIGLWLLVVLFDGGPGLFWSQRIGRHGRIFWMPKYRTMNACAPLSPRETLQGANGHITPLGAFLRRSSLDELPQLFCVFFGQMSLIGPRPLLPDDPAIFERHSFPHAMLARPGLSGLAQVVGRNEVTPRRKARLDALYARTVSPRVDLFIFWRTAMIVLSGRGQI